MTGVGDSPVVRVTRIITAPPDRVYRAWLDPDLIRRWFAPNGYTATDAVVDERVGGRHSIRHRDGETDVGGFESLLIELEPDRRIVFAWGFVGPDHIPDPAHESRLTVELRPVGNGHTELTLIHERLQSLRKYMPDVADGVEVGWQQALNKLADVMSDHPTTRGQM